jgi:hypothetical protein
MVNIKKGELVCFESDRWGHLLENSSGSISRAIYSQTGSRNLILLAHPTVPVGWDEEVEIVVYKLLETEPQFVFSDKTRATTSASAPDLIEISLTLHNTPWGGGTYRIDLHFNKTVVAQGQIDII